MSDDLLHGNLTAYTKARERATNGTKIGHVKHNKRFRVNQSIFMGGPKQAEKLETSYFNFGSYDWSLSVYSSGRSDSVLGE